MSAFVKERVRYYFCDKDLNCAGTTVLVLAEHFNVRIEQQVLDAAVGMHGAGGFRAQCGIVEGALMFIGIFGTDRGLPEKDVATFCKAFAESFVATFGSLSCSVLRPTGFRKDDPPHLCEELTVKAVVHSIWFIREWS
ncbi:MAG: C-GCAxxG-C-C family protein [Candidatus Pacearchaeota archaeon]|nr:C-GCAxxG-C-C family protein [Candidatus Pacearchaeota archaeon]